MQHIRVEVADWTEIDAAQAEARKVAERMGFTLTATRTVDPTEDGRLVVEWGLTE